MEEARSMSGLSPVARMDRPSRVRKKATMSTQTTSRITASTISSCHLAHQSAATRPLARENRLSLP